MRANDASQEVRLLVSSVVAINSETNCRSLARGRTPVLLFEEGFSVGDG